MNQGVDYLLGEVIPSALDSGLFTSLCTIQQPDTNLGASGAPSGNWVNVAGMVNIKCMVRPQSEIKVMASELKTIEEIMALNPRHVLLAGYFLVDPSWRAVIDGENLDVLGVEHDSQKRLTRMSVRTAKI